MPTAQKTYAMLVNQNLWDTPALSERVLSDAGVSHSVCGGVAVCLHGYQRNTVDLDVIVQKSDVIQTRELLQASGLAGDATAREFRTKAGIAIQFLISGETAGRSYEMKDPIPIGDQNVEVIEGLTVLRLSRLIEIKIACGLANMRRTHKDFADVVELIAIRRLDGSFSRFLHKSLRKTLRELAGRVNDDA